VGGPGGGAWIGRAALPTGEDGLHMAGYNLGNKSLELARWQDAIASYEKSIAIRPRFISSRNNLALAYERAGRRDDAIRTWSEVLAWSASHGELERAERARRHLAGLGAALPEAD